MSNDTMAKNEKCAHSACNCSVSPNSPFGKYCSQHCEQTKDIVELKCDCGHPGCS